MKINKKKKTIKKKKNMNWSSLKTKITIKTKREKSRNKI